MATVLQLKDLNKNYNGYRVAIMSNKYDHFKRNDSRQVTTWVYDEKAGWIDINQFLKDIKRMQKKLNVKLKTS